MDAVGCSSNLVRGLVSTIRHRVGHNAVVTRTLGDSYGHGTDFTTSYEILRKSDIEITSQSEASHTSENKTSNAQKMPAKENDELDTTNYQASEFDQLSAPDRQFSENDEQLVASFLETGWLETITTKLSFKEIKELTKQIDYTEISVRLANCLKSLNIVYFYDVVQFKEIELLRTKNFGRKSLKELKGQFDQLKLGMDLDGLSFDLIFRLASEVKSVNNVDLSGFRKLTTQQLRNSLKPIASFDLNVRARNVLDNLDIQYLGAVGAILCQSY